MVSVCNEQDVRLCQLASTQNLTLTWCNADIANICVLNRTINKNC